MKPVYDKHSVALILRHGIEKGYWTLEHLDFPTADYERQIHEARQSRFFGPDFTPAKPYVNPLRSSTTIEVVAAEPEHDDLASAASPNEGQPDVDVSIGLWPHLSDQHYRPDLSCDQDSTADGGDHGQPSHLAATGRSGASVAGGDGSPAVEPIATPWPAGAAPW